MGIAWQNHDFRAIFEATPGLFLVFDARPDHKIVAVSDSFLRATQADRGAILGKGLFEVFPDDPTDPGSTGVQLRASLERILQSKAPDAMAIQSYDLRSPLLAKNNAEERHWSPLNTPVFNDNGEVRYIIHRVEDVTEYVRLSREQERLLKQVRSETSHQEKARRSQRLEAMGQLAGGVAHDFNNILAAILINCEAAMSNQGLSKSLKTSLDRILRDSERAAALTRQLLAFSRQQVLPPSVLSLNLVVKDIHSMLSRLIGEGVDLRMRLEENLGNTLIDRGQLEQVIVNLVVNARDAMPKGGQITITTSNVHLDPGSPDDLISVPAGDYVRLTVRDDGIGMDAETLVRIFEPFFTTKGVGKGTGLGLATVFGIVQQNKGTIRVFSEPGQGTIFKIFFPRVAHPASTAVQLEMADLSADSVHKKKILVVEDEESLRTAMCEILRLNGYTVLEAANGVKALSVLDEDPAVDLIISDVVMPKMGGKALAKKLSRKGRHIKMLFLSGYTEDVLSAHGMAGSQFLEKPFRMKALLDEIRCLL